MQESTNSAEPLTTQQHSKLELLHAVLSQDETYPWNPSEPAAAAYLDQLEREATATTWSEEAFDSQWSQVSHLASQLWESPGASLVATLAEKFSARMPADLLDQIAQSAQAAADGGQALIDQLVISAQSVLTGWAADDLQVMARPLAMAMRGDKADLDATINSIRSAEWHELSEVEQARLSLAIARYALAEIATAD